MARLSVLQRFEGLKTKSKFLATFGMISVIIMTMSAIGVLTLRQLATSSQAVYVDYTVPLAEFAEMGTALATHHQILTGIAGVTRQADFIADVTRLSPYQAKVKKIVADYAAKVLRVSRSGRDETKDLAVLKPAIEKYFKDGEGALSAMADSFGKSFSAEQAEHMRDLGKLALTVDLQSTFEAMVARHNEQVLDMHEVAKDLHEDAQTLAANGRLMLIAGGIFAVALSLALGYWVAHKLSLSIGHVANAVKLAAGGNYQARAKITSKDELGQMAASFNAMLDRMTALVTSESERDDMQKRLMGFLVLVSDIGNQRHCEPDEPPGVERGDRSRRCRRSRSPICRRRRPGQKTGRKFLASDARNRRSGQSHSERDAGSRRRDGKRNQGGGSRVEVRYADR
jgi:twitching motility protein PilJ